jgi:hypothetical protein
MDRYELTCSVCGTLLGYTAVDRKVSGAVFCTDRPCILYPPTTTSRAEDPTLPGLCVAILEGTPTTAAALSRTLNKNPGYAGILMKQQEKRWDDFT